MSDERKRLCFGISLRGTECAFACCWRRLPRPHHSGVLELLYFAVEIEHLGNDHIDADGHLVAVVVQTVPNGATLLPHQLAFHQVAD